MHLSEATAFTHCKLEWTVSFSTSLGQLFGTVIDLKETYVEYLPFEGNSEFINLKGEFKGSECKRQLIGHQSK